MTKQEKIPEESMAWIIHYSSRDSVHQICVILLKITRPMDNQYRQLLNKLDQFIRKYYKNRLIRGGIYCLSVLIAFFLLFTILEHFGHFNSTVRLIFFYAYLLINTGIVIRYLFIPLLKLFRLGKTLSHEEAARIIGTHFHEVADKLLNTLQLWKMQQGPGPKPELLPAGITQKIKEIKPVHFPRAIDYKRNKKYLKYLAFPLLFLIIVIVVAPSMVTDPTTRIVKYNTHFAETFPFKLSVLNQPLTGIQQEDFRLNVGLSGDRIPDEVFLESAGTRYKLLKDNTIRFHYVFKSVQKDISFRLLAGKFVSEEYFLSVIPKPVILNFSVTLAYPAYTQREGEEIQNNGDLLVPEGTKTSWIFYARDADSIRMTMGEEIAAFAVGRNQKASYEKTCLEAEKYSIAVKNKYMANQDILNYSIHVIKDAYPAINVEQLRDSIFDNRIYYRGLIRDDYGFSRLTFHTVITRGEATSEPILSVNDLDIDRKSNQQSYYHFLDLKSLDIQPGDYVESYFTVWDNDAIHGAKATVSEKMILKVPTLEDMEEREEAMNDQIKSEMENILQESRALQKKVEEFSRKMLDKPSLSWMEKKQLDEFLEDQKDLQDRFEKIEKENEMKTFQEQQYKEMDPAILEKQKQLQDLFNELLTDEMKKMIEELKAMLDKIDKNKVNEMLEKIQFQNKDLEKQLDRGLELFKQLEFDKKLKDAISKLEDLAKKQEELSEQTQDKKAEKESLIEKQDKLNNEFQDIRKDLDDLEKMNKELEEPADLKNTDQQENEINREQENSMENMRQNKMKNASGNQKNASEKMKSMAEEMQEMADQMEMEQNAEDMDQIRSLLEDLVNLSISQEEVMLQLKKVAAGDPRYIKLVQEQKEIKDDLKVVEDSLTALGKRQVEVKPMISRELTSVAQNMDAVMEMLHQRNIPASNTRQQYIMTSINNLALMLAEALKNMEQNMSMQASGKSGKSCPNPSKSGKIGAKSLKKMQEGLSKQLQGLKEQLEKSGKPGQRSSEGRQMSEQMARLAAEQEAIRNMMQKYSEMLKEQGINDGGNSANAVKEMEKIENDLINKRISSVTLRRQQDILTRLLESEKAEMRREFEEKRESREGGVYEVKPPKEFFDEKSGKTGNREQLKRVSPAYRPYYRDRINSYFLNLQNQK